MSAAVRLPGAVARYEAPAPTCAECPATIPPARVELRALTCSDTCADSRRARKLRTYGARWRKKAYPNGRNWRKPSAWRAA